MKSSQGGQLVLWDSSAIVWDMCGILWDTVRTHNPCAAQSAQMGIYLKM